MSIQSQKNKKQKIISAEKALLEKGVDSSFAMQYNLNGAGWATFLVTADNQQHTFAVSYLHDSLEQLAGTVIHILSDQSSEGLVVFMDEPGELQLSLKRLDNGLLRVTGTWYTDWASWNMSSTHKVLFTLLTTAQYFAEEVKNLLDDIYTRYGGNGYKERWLEAEFPAHAHSKLAKLLKEINENNVT